MGKTKIFFITSLKLFVLILYFLNYNLIKSTEKNCKVKNLIRVLENALEEGLKRISL